MQVPPSSPEFPFFEHKNNPPPLWNFLKFHVHPRYPLDKIVLQVSVFKLK